MIEKDYQEHIELNPKVMLGKPVIKCTRVPVELILRKLAEGASPEDLLDAYPGSAARASKQRWVMRPEARAFLPKTPPNAIMSLWMMPPC